MEEFPKLKEKLRVVVFCGGYGIRMWPMSRQKFPKQFQPLLGESSFFQETIKRVKLGFKTEDIFVSTSKDQVSHVQRQAPEIPPDNIIAEPERRDTLGAVAYATAFLDQKFPNSLMAVVWGADHLVRNPQAFNEYLQLAARIAQKETVICKIDVRPTYPSTANGWVKIGKVIGYIDRHSVYEFEKFIEKPDLETVQKLFKDKNYLINVGYYVWRTSLMLRMIEKYAPDCYQHIKKIRPLFGQNNQDKVINREYAQIEKISIDFGVFEKLPPKSMMALIGDIGWYDIGTWDLLYEALAHGQKENVNKGEVKFLDSQGNLVYIPSKKIAALIDCHNLIIVDTPDGLVICQRRSAEKIKKIVEQLKAENKTEYL